MKQIGRGHEQGSRQSGRGPLAAATLASVFHVEALTREVLMINYVFPFLDPEAPALRGRLLRDRSLRSATERRAAERPPHAAPRSRNIATPSALLTGMLWRGALISGEVLPSFAPTPWDVPWGRLSGLTVDPRRARLAARSLGSALITRLQEHRGRLARA